MNLPNDTSSGKPTYLGHDPFEVTMSIPMPGPTAQSRGCQKKRDKYYKIIMLAKLLSLDRIPCNHILINHSKLQDHGDSLIVPMKVCLNSVGIP